MKKVGFKGINHDLTLKEMWFRWDLSMRNGDV